MRNRLHSSEYATVRQDPDEKLDPITLYNRVIKHYNNPANIQRGIPLSTAYTDRTYRFWYKLLRHWYLLTLLLYLAPYLTFITIILTLYAMIVHENALAVYNTNCKTNHDLFENMVLSDQLCKKANLHIIYYSVNSGDIDSFPFSAGTKLILKSRENIETGKVRFMVYDRVYLTWSEALKKCR